MWTTMSGNERGKDMREEIRTFISYMEEEKHASKNTTLSYQRDLLKMADYLEENGITDCGLQPVILFLDFVFIFSSSIIAMPV